jgi:hypothetical protein
MKIFPQSAVLLVSAAIGYTGVILIPRSTDTMPTFSNTSTASPSPTSSTKIAPAKSPLPSEMQPFAAATGPALAVQISTSLKLAGIDPAWAEDLAAADASGFPALLEKMATLPISQKTNLTTILLGRWATLDSLGGAAFFKSKNDESNLTALFVQWGQIDFESAAAKALEYGDKCVRLTLSEKARLDPAAFLAWTKDHPDINPLDLFNSDSSENSEALERLAALDPDRVLAWSKSVPEAKWNEGFANTFAAQLAKRSPEEAIAWAKGLTDPLRTQAALCGVASSLAGTQPDRALTLLRELPANGDYTIRGLQAAILAKLTPADPDQAMALSRSFPPGDVRDRIVKRTMDSLIKKDPVRAFALADSLGPEAGPNLQSFISENIKDPGQARRIMEAAPQAGDSSFRQAATKAALLVWMQSDPTSLGSWLNGRMETPLLSSMKEDLQSGMALLALQTGQPIDPALLSAVGDNPKAMVQALLQKDPARAAASMENVTDPASRKQSAGEIAKAWVAQDRGDALAWAGTLTEPVVQAEAWQAIAAHWLGEDSHKASEWITTLPPGTARDAAVVTMTLHIEATDPDLSWKWALTLSDPALKTKTLQQVTQQWSRQDATAARSALESSGLSAAERQMILESPVEAPVK